MFLRQLQSIMPFTTIIAISTITTLCTLPSSLPRNRKTTLRASVLNNTFGVE
ncbi:16762_t:CDS:2 [Cetraspora pellucida]|uniref:16762_t:CDS:1 n=1 Tax=Cetraspora pellucida TaxID=1433469 RepID=A0A9N9CSM9_9GLOM|nr:16762_t:CDS:2 [Cetraspora pellucida]